MPFDLMAYTESLQPRRPYKPPVICFLVYSPFRFQAWNSEGKPDK